MYICKTRYKDFSFSKSYMTQENDNERVYAISGFFSYSCGLFYIGNFKKDLLFISINFDVPHNGWSLLWLLLWLCQRDDSLCQLVLDVHQGLRYKWCLYGELLYEGSILINFFRSPTQISSSILSCKVAHSLVVWLKLC